MSKEKQVEYFETADKLSQDYLKSISLEMDKMITKDEKNFTASFVMANLSFLMAMNDYIELVKAMGGKMDLKDLTNILLKMDKDLKKQQKKEES